MLTMLIRRFGDNQNHVAPIIVRLLVSLTHNGKDGDCALKYSNSICELRIMLKMLTLT